MENIISWHSAGGVLVILLNRALPGLRLAIGVDNGQSGGRMK